MSGLVGLALGVGWYALDEPLAVTVVAAAVVGLVVALPRLVVGAREKRRGSVAVER